MLGLEDYLKRKPASLFGGQPFTAPTVSPDTTDRRKTNTRIPIVPMVPIQPCRRQIRCARACPWCQTPPRDRRGRTGGAELAAFAAATALEDLAPYG